MTKLAAIALLLLAFGGGNRPPDRVELVSGEKIEGYVLLETKDEVVVLVKSKERRIPRKQVASVRRAATTLQEVLDRHEKLERLDAKGMVELARHCQDLSLPGEAEVLALAALVADPANAEAHALLGHVKRQAGWMAKRGNQQVLFEKLTPARTDLRQPWKLETSHYALLTNLSLHDATCLALDLERYYRAFFELLDGGVDVIEVVEPLGVGVYGDDRTFPEGLEGRAAFYDKTTRQVLINAARVDPQYALVHEATHQLLFATASGTRAGLGVVPGWIDEGLAEYMAWSRTGHAGRATFDLGAISDEHFTTHRDAPKPYDLSRVLQFESGDFHGSSKQDLKYAQSYTLVHFFLHAQGGKYRSKFFEFLRGAYAGSSSSTDFKKVVDVPEKELKAEWLAHVRNPVR
ncbi:MAG: DUF1570 domain-containing protein [Planctomycetota bacterium]